MTRERCRHSRND